MGYKRGIEIRFHEYPTPGDECDTSAGFRMKSYEYPTPLDYTRVRRMSHWCCCLFTRTPRVNSTPVAKRLTPSTAPHGSLSGVARITEMFTSTSGRGRHRRIPETSNRPLLPASAIPPGMTSDTPSNVHGSFVGLHTVSSGPRARLLPFP